MTARHALFEKIGRDLDYALAHAGGAGRHGGHRDTEAWRRLPREQLVEQLVTFLAAGLGPALDRQAVEDGTRAARRVLAEHAATVVDHERPPARADLPAEVA